MSRESHDQHILEQLPPTRAQKLLKIITSYYFIALVIGACFSWLFGWLADEVTDNEFGVDNTAILLNIHAHRSALFDRIAFGFTWLGSPGGIVLISILIISGLWMLKRHVDMGMY